MGSQPLLVGSHLEGLKIGEKSGKGLFLEQTFFYPLRVFTPGRSPGKGFTNGGVKTPGNF